MGKDVLSQSEIDSLISALSTGDLDQEEEEEKAEEYQTYDFRRPTKFSKEQLRTLQIIHENYARILGNFLTAYLRVPVKLEVQSVSQVTYEEFIFSLPVPTLVTIFNMSPDLGVAMLESNPTVVFPLIDLVFGGSGKSNPTPRELTEIELSVMEQLNIKLLDNLSYVWKGIAELDPQIESMDSNPQFNQVIATSETVALVTISAEIQDHKGFINLSYPYITLERVINKLTAQQWFNQYSQQDSYRLEPQALKKFLSDSSVEVKAILGTTAITLEDFLHLQEGDVLQLNRQEGEPLEVYIEDKPMFRGQPGLKGSRMAIKVHGWTEEMNRKNQQNRNQQNKNERNERRA